MLKKTPQSLSDTKLLREQGYRLIKLVGEGSYAQVYLGEFIKGPGESIRLACKIINAAKARKSYTQKFLPREIKVLSSIKHPHIIHIYSIFQRKASYFIFMRYAEKGDLFEYIKLNGPIKENQARVWVRQIALAIQYLHTLDIAHRDLKCENVLVTTHLNLKLTDFGFARYVKNELGLAELSETFCGSKQYVAPEILHGAQYDAKAADMWSFGVIIYTTLNKSLPFNQRDKRLLYSAQMKKEWGFRRRVIDTVSSEVRDLVTSLLEPDPLKRIDIGSVVNSSWIGMDAKLQKLSKDESDALYAALEATKSVGGRISIPGNDDRGLPAKRFSRQSKDVVYWKHMHTGLEVDVSRLNKFDDVI